MSTPFNHLHLHTQYSLMEGAIRIKPLAKALKEKGYTACAITDHGNMFGAVEFETTLKKEGLKPIIGMGAYIARTNRHEREQGFRDTFPYQTNLLCQNREGYQSLTRLASTGFLEGKHRGIPRVDHELLEQYHSGLIALSGGMGGELDVRLKDGKYAEALEVAKWYQQLFDGRYYIELQNTGLHGQDEINQQLLQISQELSLPLVASNACYYLSQEEADAHYILELMRMQKRVTDAHIPPMKPSEFYLKTQEEMQQAFQGLPEEALLNTQQIIDQCDLSLDNDTYFLPNVDVPKEHDLDSWLRHLSQEGLQQRLEKLYELYEPEEDFETFRKPYDERLDFELNIIIQMKFPGYFLIVADFINWAKDNGVPVGPGRGSGAGSLVAYAIRITDVDPLRYGLLFERFLNPDRISMPDFDIDFEVSGRERVIEYVRQHYGEKNVCQIATFQSLGAKAAIRNVARVLDFAYSDADKIAKLIPNKLGISLQESLDQEPELSALETSGTDAQKKLIHIAKTLEGLTTHLGTHAAGVIIMDTDIQEVMPVCSGKEGGIQSMFTMKYAEHQGAVKFDFLGLLNLSIIDEAAKLVNHERPKDDPIDIDGLPMDDEKTFQLFCSGDTTGVFQLESSGMKKLLLDMKPSVFEDIVAILALYRPGPLGSGMVDDFIQCKHGRKQVVYPHPLLEGILKETYGVMVYQEQIMQAVQVLAGFTLGQADLLRRAIGKKIPEILAEQRLKFVEGCVANAEYVQKCKGDPAQTANDIFDLIDYFSGYGFNKSHTVAYGLISYQTAYLKAHYPVPFMAALLNCSMSNPDKVVNFISECRDMEVDVLPPDVNFSQKEFTVSPIDPHGRVETSKHTQGVRFGLNAVKNVGGSAVDAILEARKKKEGHRFESFMDFCKSVDLSRVNKRMLEILTKCGAFDSINPNRRQIFEVLDEAIYLGQEFQKAEDSQQNSLFELLDESEARQTETQLKLPDVKDWRNKQRLELEKESLGFYVSGHPLHRYQSEIDKIAISTEELREKDYADGTRVTLAGIVITNTIRLTKSSEKFAIVKIEDLRGSIEFPVYTKVYAQYGEVLDANEPVFVKGRVNHRDDEIGIVAEEIMLCSQYREENAKALTIEVGNDVLTEEALQHLRGAFMKAPGPCKIRFKVNTPEKTYVGIQLQESFAPTPNCMDEVDELLIHHTLHFRYT